MWNSASTTEVPVAMFRPLRTLAAGLFGYVVGMLPSADLAASVAGGDVRNAGTGNPGALNTHHVLGPRWAVAVSAADVGKGVAAARVGGVLAGSAGANLAATAAVAGHCFPLGRRGGKGVATSVGQVVATFPAYLPIDIGVAAATSVVPFFRQRTRVATSVASATWVGCSVACWRAGYRNPGGVRPTVALPLAAVASSAVIAARFRTEAGRVEDFNADSREVAA